MQVFQSEHQLFPAVYSQCVADSCWVESYIIHILTQPCGRLVSPDENTRRKYFSLFLFFPSSPGLNCLLTINSGAKSYQRRDHFQRRGSRLQTKQQPYRCSRRVHRGVSRTSEQPLHKYRKRHFPRYRHRKHSPKQRQTATSVLERGSPIILLGQSTCRAGGEKM